MVFRCVSRHIRAWDYYSIATGLTPQNVRRIVGLARATGCSALSNDGVLVPEESNSRQMSMDICLRAGAREGESCLGNEDEILENNCIQIALGVEDIPIGELETMIL